MSRYNNGSCLAKGVVSGQLSAVASLAQYTRDSWLAELSLVDRAGYTPVVQGAVNARERACPLGGRIPGASRFYRTYVSTSRVLGACIIRRVGLVTVLCTYCGSTPYRISRTSQCTPTDRCFDKIAPRDLEDLLPEYPHFIFLTIILVTGISSKPGRATFVKQTSKTRWFFIFSFFFSYFYSIIGQFVRDPKNHKDPSYYDNLFYFVKILCFISLEENYYATVRTKAKLNMKIE